MKDSLQQKRSKRIRNRNLRLLIFVPIGLLILSISLFTICVKLNDEVNAQVLNVPNLSFKPSPYPILSQQMPAGITASGIAILDTDSQVILYSKNPTQYFSPASTTKILTALTAMDKFRLNDVLTVKSQDVDGSVIGLRIGDKLTFQDLLYAMMLPSANDAAATIAQNYPGGQTAFVQVMNEKAKALNLYSLHVDDPVGLDDEKDFTTPVDLARLAGIAMQNKIFAKIVDTRYKTIKTLEGREFDLANLNILLGENGVNGVKTGYTESAGQVLVTSQKVRERSTIIVVMESLDRFGDTQKILNTLSGGLTYLTIAP